MSAIKLHLTVVSQERALVDTEVDSVTAMSSEGELTILPHHIPLFTRLVEGVLRYKSGQTDSMIVVSRGFLSLDNKNHLTVMVDSAVLEREISEEKAQAAIRAAEETLSKSSDQRELLMAEASLRLALLEIRLAQKTRKTSI